MDIIFLNDLKIETIIGIYDWERETKQTISLVSHFSYKLKYVNGIDCILYFFNKTMQYR